MGQRDFPFFFGTFSSSSLGPLRSERRAYTISPSFPFFWESAVSGREGEKHFCTYMLRLITDGEKKDWACFLFLFLQLNSICKGFKTVQCLWILFPAKKPAWHWSFESFFRENIGIIYFFPFTFSLIRHTDRPLFPIPRICSLTLLLLLCLSFPFM